MLKTEGIVLSEIRYKETSKILRVYTKELGKISVMAKGAYKPKSQLIANTQPFSYNEYQFQEGKGFYYIVQGDILDSFYDIRENIERVIYGYYILELIDKSTVEEDENQRLFLLLEKGLRVLSKLEKDFLKFIISFELKFISFLGYRPYIHRCVICGEENNNIIRFSNVEGGIICNNCFNEDYSAISIDKQVLEGMNKLLFASLDNIDEVDISKELLTRIHYIIEKYILYSIDRKEFNSLNMLKTMIDI